MKYRKVSIKNFLAEKPDTFLNTKLKNKEEIYCSILQVKALHIVPKPKKPLFIWQILRFSHTLPRFGNFQLLFPFKSSKRKVLIDFLFLFSSLSKKLEKMNFRKAEKKKEKEIKARKKEQNNKAGNCEALLFFFSISCLSGRNAF